MKQMMDIRNSWLFNQLANIYAPDDLFIFFNKEEAPLDLVLFPVKREVDILGWVGLSKTLLRDDSIALIQVLVETQNQFLYQQEEMGSEEVLWKRILTEDMASWKEQWNTLVTEKQQMFRNVYIEVREENELDAELTTSLKEVMEGIVEEKSYFIPLYKQKYIWVIPATEKINLSLHTLIKDIADTITSEVMINVIFYIGQAYLMPRDLRNLVKQELEEQKVIVEFNMDYPVFEWKDIVIPLLLNESSQEKLEKMVERVIGNITEDQDMIQTLKVFFQENLNVSETAKKLFIHRNSLQYRLEKLYERTRLDVRKFDDAVKIYIAIQALGMFNKE